jgi:hypothetical protein
MEMSKFFNGDKKAVIVREEYNYTVCYYLKDKIIQKEVTADFTRAEELAESFILSEENNFGPKLLNEDN